MKKGDNRVAPASKKTLYCLKRLQDPFYVNGAAYIHYAYCLGSQRLTTMKVLMASRLLPLLLLLLLPSLVPAQQRQQQENKPHLENSKNNFTKRFFPGVIPILSVHKSSLFSLSLFLCCSIYTSPHLLIFYLSAYRVIIKYCDFFFNNS